MRHVLADVNSGPSVLRHFTHNNYSPGAANMSKAQRELRQPLSTFDHCVGKNLVAMTLGDLIARTVASIPNLDTTVCQC